MLLFMPQHTGHKWKSDWREKLSKNCIRKKDKRFLAFEKKKNVISWRALISYQSRSSRVSLSISQPFYSLSLLHFFLPPHLLPRKKMKRRRKKKRREKLFFSSLLPLKHKFLFSALKNKKKEQKTPLINFIFISLTKKNSKQAIAAAKKW